MKNLAIITARSGSKGLPHKNIKLLHGKPLLAYSIIAAKDSGLFDEIFVSTDSEEYAQIAKKWGAQVPFLRSLKTATDTATSWDVVKETLAAYQKIGKTFDTITLLQPTSPLRQGEDIVNGYKLLEKQRANTVVGVCEMDHSPLWSNTLPEDRNMNNFILHNAHKIPRQQLDPYYRINGALYIMKVEQLDDIEHLYNDRCYAYVMSKERSIDIDEEIDFIIAGAILKSKERITENGL